MPSADGIRSLDVLADEFGKLGGVGRRTAQRLAFAVLDLSDEEASRFASAILDAKRNIHRCPVCQNLTDEEICPVCSDTTRDRSVICVVQDTKSLLAIEKVREYHGLYHVLHGLISPMQGITPDGIRLRELVERVGTDGEVKEIIIATNPTAEGEATAMYIARLLRPLGVKVTRIANGIPVGGELEFADEYTLQRAFEGRREF
ncbi:MAG: recombination protein RecR [Clostridia bacterium]|nr:recombination protein RecR [Clostridia bacterium]MBQ7591815.1 recombination protein RecR [Clostridia bacterium]